MDLTSQEKRDVASLKSHRGFQILTTKILKECVDRKVSYCRKARTLDDLSIQSGEWRGILEALEVASTAPQVCEDSLKQEGDVLYA